MRPALVAASRDVLHLLNSSLSIWADAKRSPITLAAGMAADFEAGTSEYLSHAGNAALRGPSGTGGWWRAGWINLESSGANLRVCGSRPDANNGWRLDTTTADKLELSAGSGSSGVTALHGTALSTATWYFWFAYYDGTNIGVSLNAGAAVTQALDTYSPGAGTFQLGATVTPNGFFDGLMQCFGGDSAFYGLTPAQLATVLYNGGTPLSYAQARDAGVAIGASTGFYFELNEPSGARVDLVAGYSLTDNNTVTTAAGTCLNAVSQIDDLSGNANHVVMTTQANRPYWRPTYTGSRPAIQGYANSYLIKAAPTGLGAGNKHVLIVAAGKASLADGTRLILLEVSAGNAGNEFLGTYFLNAAITTNLISYTIDEGATQTTVTAADTFGTSARRLIVNFVLNGTSKLIREGTTDGTSTDYDTDVSAGAVGTVAIGGRNGGTLGFIGGWREIIVSTRSSAFTDAEINRLVRRLQREWS